MIASDRPEFEQHIGVLCAGFDVPCTDERKEAYWLGLQKMPLPRLIRTIRSVLQSDTWTRIPKPSQLWAESRRGIELPPPAAPQKDEFTDRPWLMAGNRYLLGHITKRLQANSRAYGVRDSAEFKANVAKLVAGKNAWVADMEQIAVEGEVAPQMQREIWADYLGEAERHLS